MQFPAPLIRGRLVRRYKRFLADVVLETGEAVTATCPNTGSLLGLAEPGATVWLSESDSPTRKYRHTWEMVESQLSGASVLVGINTGLPNRLVAEAIAARRLKPLSGYPQMRREVNYGNASRIDLLLESPRQGLCYVEIKNVHMMRRSGLAEFPDSVTERGAKHLGELAAMVGAGHRAVMLFLIQRADAKSLSLARDIDPRYGTAFDKARTAGVEVLAYRCRLALDGISVEKRVRVTG